MRIFAQQHNDTVMYAAEELKSYITKISRGTIVPLLCFVSELPRQAEDGIILAGLEELCLDTSDLNDPFVEDIIDIDVTDGVGYIAGSNPRSILMGVYKYCTSAGCRFIRPGADGEYVPHADLYNHSFKYRKKADYPFRGECCEGAISYEHMRDTVYWLPKVGMNMYMIECMIPYSYMHRWYGHVGNVSLRQKGQVTDHGMLQGYVSLLEQDIKKVGLQLHTLGHGWMFKKLGVNNGPFEQQKAALREEDKRYLAMLNGKRDLNRSVAFTHFCYSNPETRKLLVDTLVEYIEEKPFVDFVHVWLADSVNNDCECDECVKLHPTDHYVTLLNDLDEALDRIGADTRIAFIGYNETERPPQTTALKHPERFLFISAIGMHYDKGYKKVVEAPMAEEPVYHRNDRHTAPDTVRMKWRREWKERCGNVPNVIYEYRFYTDMYCDLGNMQISRETHRDMRDLEEVGFEGCMNDQTHRMYMPTSLPLITMGETLFDKTVDFDELADTYFEGAFGDDWRQCREYLEILSVLLSPSNFRVGGRRGVEEEALGDMETLKKSWKNNPEVAKRAARIPKHLEEFQPVIVKNIALATDPARMLSWRYLAYHSEICRRFSELLLAGAEGRDEDAKEKCYELEKYLSEHELEFHHGFDVLLFMRAVKLKLGIKPAPMYD